MRFMLGCLSCPLQRHGLTITHHASISPKQCAANDTCLKLEYARIAQVQITEPSCLCFHEQAFTNPHQRRAVPGTLCRMTCGPHPCKYFTSNWHRNERAACICTTQSRPSTFYPEPGHNKKPMQSGMLTTRSICNQKHVKTIPANAQTQDSKPNSAYTTAEIFGIQCHGSRSYLYVLFSPTIHMPSEQPTRV